MRLAALRLPVLAVSIDGDRYAPPAAVDQLCAKMGSAEVERWHFDPAAAGQRGINHFRWARQPDPIVARVRAWVARIADA